MNHADHVQLLRDGVIRQSSPDSQKAVWADLGSGGGAFTLALADLLNGQAVIYSVDRDRAALREQETEMRARFPAAEVKYVTADFTRLLDLPPLDGLIMANSLHYQRDQPRMVSLARSYLRPAGRMLVVEYNIDKGNFAVPHPVPFERWQTLAEQAGFAETKLLGTRPSRFLREIYSAMSC